MVVGVCAVSVIGRAEVLGILTFMMLLLLLILELKVERDALRQNMETDDVS